MDTTLEIHHGLDRVDFSIPSNAAALDPAAHAVKELRKKMLLWMTDCFDVYVPRDRYDSAPSTPLTPNSNSNEQSKPIPSLKREFANRVVFVLLVISMFTFFLFLSAGQIIGQEAADANVATLTYTHLVSNIAAFAAACPFYLWIDLLPSSAHVEVLRIMSPLVIKPIAGIVAAAVSQESAGAACVVAFACGFFEMINRIVTLRLSRYEYLRSGVMRNLMPLVLFFCPPIIAAIEAVLVLAFFGIGNFDRDDLYEWIKVAFTLGFYKGGHLLGVWKPTF